MASPVGNQPLPTKEAALFRQLVKFYETKQYKKAIKAADQILKKSPEHGETLAMKGLTLNYMDRKEEAYELVRRGLKADLKSHVCWHVYGLLYRADNNYKEAIKCYLNALRIDKENIQILRDLAMLQIQMRDIPGFVDTRYQLLQLKASNRNHWISFAVAHHLDNNFEVAIQVINAYESTLAGDMSASDAYEHSELLLYKASVLQEGGKAEEALELLRKEKDNIKDKLGKMTAEAELLLTLGRLGEAAAAYKTLLAQNPDNYELHAGLQACLGLRPSSDGVLTERQRAELSELYEQLAGSYPSSSACRRVPLDFKVGAGFEAAADAYVRRYLTKGIPSLFSDLKPLYSDPEKVAALGRLFEGYLASLNSTGALPALSTANNSATSTSGSSNNGDGSSNHGSSSNSKAADGAAAGDAAAGNAAGSTSTSSAATANGIDTSGGPAGTGEPEDGSIRTWVLLFLAQHLDRLGSTERALSLLGEAIAAAPAVVELHTARARVLKHAGDWVGSAEAAEAARQLDLSDRYLNSMAVRALFKAGRIRDAERTANMFTRDGDAGNNLYDMQHMWYECHCGDAYYRQKELGKALKKYMAVGKHFGDISEDQFDFHSYCIRKMTLRAYIAMLRLEDGLYGHAFYSKATTGAIKCYLDLYDAAQAAPSNAADDEAAMAALSPDERKKLRLKRKKEEKRREKEAAEAKEAAEKAAAAERAEREAAEAAQRQENEASSSGDKKGKKPAAAKAVDPDPDGAKLAATEDPLGEATKLVQTLKQHAGSRQATHLAAFEVYSRKGRLLLALGAVQRALATAGEGDAAAHRLVVRFCRQVEAQPPSNPVVKQVVDEGLQALLGTSSSGSSTSGVVQAYAEAYITRYSNSSLPQRASGVEMLALLDGSQKAAGVKALLAAAPSSSDSSSGNGSSSNGSAVSWGVAFAAGPPSLLDCVAVHALLSGEAPLADAAAAEQWACACAKAFPWSQHFGGQRRTQGGGEAQGVNGMVDALKGLAVGDTKH